MTPLSASLPSEDWQQAGVHWHAFIERRETDGPMRTGYRQHRLRQAPNTVLWSPWSVAEWMDARTREHILHAEVWSIQDREWISIGDEDDLDELRQQNFLIASKGDSIYSDIYTSANVHHDLFVEAVTHEQCTHDCTPDPSDNGTAA
ncbi:hypothetical protein [Actinokineospora sp. HUAS TT18]|uniref:hypothetical protein n=1 Tax=Actinokineospora sp. HUAS TT18 TaxID=3447451 RepID=UPI003F5274DA